MPEGKIRIADKSLKRFKAKVKEITRRNRGVRFSKVIRELNALHRGFVNYFRLANCWLPWRDLDCWIRRHLRSYRLKQCGRRNTIFKFLRKLGAKTSSAWNAIMYGGGWWNLSAKTVCQRTMDKRWFALKGLYPLVDLYRRQGFKC